MVRACLRTPELANSHVADLGRGRGAQLDNNSTASRYSSADRSSTGGSSLAAPRTDGSFNPYLYPLTLLAGDGARSVAKDSDNRGWWLLHTKPRQEKKLAEELQTLGIGNYLPVTRLKAVTRGRARYSWAPLFPGYCFLWADDDERLSALRTNRLVHTYAIADQARLVEQLGRLAELIQLGVPLTIEDRLAIGQHVRVKSGLLKDQRGVVIRRSGKTRLYVYVTEMLGGVSVEIDQHCLEPY